MSLARNTKVLIVTCSGPNTYSPSTVYFGKYFRGWPVDHLYWWSPGVRAHNKAKEWLPGENIFVDFLACAVHRLIYRIATESPTVLKLLTGCCVGLLKKWIRSKDISLVVWAVEANNWIYLKEVFRQLKDTPVIGVVHDDLFEIQKIFKSPYLITEPHYQRLLAKFDEVLVISHEMKRRYFFLDQNKVQVFHPLANESFTKPAGTNDVQPAEKKNLNLITVGSIYDPANVEKLISLLEDYCESQSIRIILHTTRKFVFPGDGHLRHVAVVNHGMLADGELDRLIGEMDAFFMNANLAGQEKELLSTQFPSKLPHYLSYGKPVLIVAPAYYPGSIFLSGYSFGFLIDKLEKSQINKMITQLLQVVRQPHLVSREEYLDAWSHFNPSVLTESWSAVLGKHLSPGTAPRFAKDAVVVE